MENNIKLLILPAHSSHFIQPLDIDIFSSLKTYISSELEKIVRSNVAHIQKAEWLVAYVRARVLAFSIVNIHSSWKGAGLFPFSA